MAYVTPSTATTGDLISAADWNKNTVDNPIALKALIDAVGTGGLNRCNGRLTLTSATPVTTSDVTAATTVYWTPYAGNEVALYDGASWAMYTFTERSIAVPATTSQMYDVFVYNNAGTITLELTAWTNDTTRATALTTQNGVYVKTGALTRRYLGSFRTTTVSGQTEDSIAKRYVWNYYNRLQRAMRKTDATASWTYTTATYRYANNSAANRLEVVVGVAESPIDLYVQADTSDDTLGTGTYGSSAIGEDVSNAPMTGSAQALVSQAYATAYMTCVSKTNTFPAVGFHYYAWLEYSSTSGTRTWYSGGTRAGIYAMWWS
jgi:hypothetical protein